jgi:zinc protease
MTPLEQAFGSWTPAALAAPVKPVPDAPQLKERRVFLVDRPGAAQSQVRIGWVGVPRSTPDYFALAVMNTILGGAFTSRLNQNLREQHGYAYGAGSVFDMRLSAGPFIAAAGVQTDKTAEALREFFKELTGILEPVPADELEKAKNYLALSFPREFETTSSIAGAIGEMILYDLPRDYFETYVSRIQQVTAPDVQRVAKRYIQPDRFAVVVVGDLKTIEAPVRALKLGPVRVVGLDEVMGAPVSQ